MKHLLFVALLLAPAITQAQTSDTAAQTTKPVFTSVDQMPAPPYNINEYLANNMRYPPAARDARLEGVISVKFIVTDSGKVTWPVVVSSHRNWYGFEREALRLIRKMPDWNPGKQNGRAVDVYITLPIPFKLAGDDGQ